ncbi:DUF1772 domain-containing protein [Streptosporangium sp. KLBMP 9127]|nr:DUF1772 domain-containing protein [Streptosporangium sp. KLBMP 9127]
MSRAPAESTTDVAPARILTSQRVSDGDLKADDTRTTVFVKSPRRQNRLSAGGMHVRKQKIGLAVSMAYAWIAIIGFGGILAETIVIYPNVFHDAPASLAESMEFFVVTGPADFFPPMGALTVLASLATLVLLWPARRARPWIGASLGSLVAGEFLFSMLFFWPRNDIMFEEGAAKHSVEFLQQTAMEFETGHWARLAMSGVTAALAFTGFLRFHRASSSSSSSAAAADGTI